MRPTLAAWLYAIASLTPLTLAQTYTSCDPTKKTCPANAGLSTSTYSHDFKQSFDKDNWSITAGNVTQTSSGLYFTINKAGDAPTIRSKWYMLFGRVSFLMRASPGTGIVSSAILQSDDLDEIDWEWLGGDNTEVQTNYFGKGNSTTYDREVDAGVGNPQGQIHNYTIVWTATSTNWIINGAVVRTLLPAAALNGENYPQTPMDVRIGSWAGGDADNSEGTIEWAGGLTSYSDGPFTMIVESVEVENFNPAHSYSYKDKSGSWESIEISGKDVAVKIESASQGLAKESQTPVVSHSGLSAIVTASVSGNATATATGSGGLMTASGDAPTRSVGAASASGSPTQSAVEVSTGAAVVIGSSSGWSLMGLAVAVMAML